MELRIAVSDSPQPAQSPSLDFLSIPEPCSRTQIESAATISVQVCSIYFRYSRGIERNHRTCLKNSFTFVIRCIIIRP